MEEHNKQLSAELKEKREVISRHLEAHSKLEFRVYDLERQLKDAGQQNSARTDQLNAEITNLKSNILVKNDDYTKYKQEFENEKTIRLGVLGGRLLTSGPLFDLSLAFMTEKSFRRSWTTFATSSKRSKQS
jgi:hypothetical protein